MHVQKKRKIQIFLNQIYLKNFNRLMNNVIYVNANIQFKIHNEFSLIEYKYEKYSSSF